MIVLAIKKVRIGESILMVAFFAIGLVYIPFNTLTDNVSQALTIVVNCFFLVQAIYLLNSYYGAESDRCNPRFNQRTIDNPSTSRIFLLLSLGLLCLSILINGFFRWGGMLLTIVNYVLWMCYADPRINLKGHYLWGTLVHFFSGIINFHLGFLPLGEGSIHSVLISIYFSLLFSAGHLHHMVIDYEADRSARIKTFANVFGISMTKSFSVSLIAVSGLYYMALVALGTVSSASGFSVVGVTVIHISLFLYYRHRMEEQTVRMRYRSIYRVLHGINFLWLALLNFHHGTL